MEKQKQCAYWFLTINEKASCFSNLQQIIDNELLSNPNIEYSYIKHNADEEEKNLHYHLVIYYKGKVKRFTTLCNTFEGAHIEMSNAQRYKRTIQYLIHKNNPEKQQYNSSEIITNIDEATLSDILGGSGYDFELFQEDKLYDYMAEFYKQYKSIEMYQFVIRFGLGALSKYYFMIKDQIQEYNHLFKRVENRLNREDIVYRAFCVQYLPYSSDFQHA